MKITSAQINEFLRRKKIDGKTKIGIALLIELMQGFAEEILSPSSNTGQKTDPQELWDKYSERIDEDIDSLNIFAGRDVITKESFMKFLSETKSL